MGGQTLMAIGALTLLSLMTLAANRTLLSSYDNQLQSSTTLVEVTVARNLLDEIQSKAFDEAITADSSGTTKLDKYRGMTPSDFTLPASLGPESGEVQPYDDVDDYNGLHIKVWNPLFYDSLDVRAHVFYVNPFNPTEPSLSVQTYAKKVLVLVFTTGMPDTLRVQQVIYE